MKQVPVIKWFSETDSTNSQMSKDKLSLPHGSIYSADFQTAGRGQKGNIWESGRGLNLTFSIMLRPSIAIQAKEQFILSEAVALGVAHYIESKGIEVRIKWPNDIFAGGHKLCGMLLETTLDGANVGCCIAGIGLNVNQTVFGDGYGNPTSMKILSGIEYETDSELEQVCRSVLSRVESIRDDESIKILKEEYLSRLYRMMEWCQFEEMPASDIPTEKRDGKRITARITGITDDARLCLEMKDGSVRTYAFKEIKFTDR